MNNHHKVTVFSPLGYVSITAEISDEAYRVGLIGVSNHLRKQAAHQESTSYLKELERELVSSLRGAAMCSMCSSLAVKLSAIADKKKEKIERIKSFYGLNLKEE